MVRIHDATDESLTLSQLASRGCVRSAHVGLLNQCNYTLAPLLAGVSVELHEFLQKASNSDYDVCSFTLPGERGCQTRIHISQDDGIWGPLARWDKVGRDLIAEKRKDLAWIAIEASGPFSFHLAATRKLYANACRVRLCSTRLLDIGIPHSARGAIIRKVLDLLAKPKTSESGVPRGRPTAFYRVIDPDGRSHYFKKCMFGNAASRILEYDNGFQISLDEAAGNVIETLYEMAEIEKHPGYVIPRRPRLVLDTAVYLATAILDDHCNPGIADVISSPVGDVATCTI